MTMTKLETTAPSAQAGRIDALSRSRRRLRWLHRAAAILSLIIAIYTFFVLSGQGESGDPFFGEGEQVLLRVALCALLLMMFFGFATALRGRPSWLSFAVACGVVGGGAWIGAASVGDTVTADDAPGLILGVTCGAILLMGVLGFLRLRRDAVDPIPKSRADERRGAALAALARGAEILGVVLTILLAPLFILTVAEGMLRAAMALPILQPFFEEAKAASGLVLSPSFWLIETQIETILIFAAVAIAALLLAAFVWVLFFRMLRRALRLILRFLAALDRRPPVLVLRSFKDDRLALRPEGLWGRLLLRRKRLEEAALRVARRAGPPLAVNQPGAMLPELGAYRLNFDDDAWQPAVQALIDRSGLILMVLGDTPWVDWELREIMRRGALDKLVVLTPPLDLAERRRRLERLSNALRDHGAASLPPEEDAATPTVAIAFDAHGATARARSQARGEMEYVDALDTVLAARRTQTAAADRPSTWRPTGWGAPLGGLATLAAFAAILAPALAPTPPADAPDATALTECDRLAWSRAANHAYAGDDAPEVVAMTKQIDLPAAQRACDAAEAAAPGEPRLALHRARLLQAESRGDEADALLAALETQGFTPATIARASLAFERLGDGVVETAGETPLDLLLRAALADDTGEADHDLAFLLSLLHTTGAPVARDVGVLTLISASEGDPEAQEALVSTFEALSAAAPVKDDDGGAAALRGALVEGLPEVIETLFPEWADPGAQPNPIAMLGAIGEISVDGVCLRRQAAQVCAAALAPDDPYGAYAFKLFAAGVQAAQENYAGLIETAEALIPLETAAGGPGASRSALSFLAQGWLGLGEPARALEAVDAALAATPSSGSHILRGEVLEALGRWPEAAAAARAALALDDDPFGAREGLIKASLRTGHLDDAVASCADLQTADRILRSTSTRAECYWTAVLSDKAAAARWWRDSLRERLAPQSEGISAAVEAELTWTAFGIADAMTGDDDALKTFLRLAGVASSRRETLSPTPPSEEQQAYALERLRPFSDAAGALLKRRNVIPVTPADPAAVCDGRAGHPIDPIGAGGGVAFDVIEGASAVAACEAALRAASTPEAQGRARYALFRAYLASGREAAAWDALTAAAELDHPRALTWLGTRRMEGAPGFLEADQSRGALEILDGALRLLDRRGAALEQAFSAAPTALAPAALRRLLSHISHLRRHNADRNFRNGPFAGWTEAFADAPPLAPADSP